MADGDARKDWVTRVLGVRWDQPAMAQDVAAPASPDLPSVAPVSNVVFQQTRLMWDASRKRAHAQLQVLQAAILADFKEAPVFDEISVLVGRLDGLLARFDDRLTDKLDEALNAATPQDRAQRHREAAAILAEYRAFVDSDPGLRLLDDNPFTAVNIQQTFQDTLDILAAKLAT
jgi:hypothetical protein